MRLSERRIRTLAKKMAQEMIRKGAVKSAAGTEDLMLLISKVIMHDQKAENDVEAEARQFLSRQRNLPPPGTGEYQAAFQQTKRQIAARKGFIF